MIYISVIDIKESLCLDMVLSGIQMRVLLMKFENADVWEHTCNEIEWTNVERDSFLGDLEVDTRLKRLMIRVAICEGELRTPYARLCLNINEGGSVKAALKLRINRMKLVYQEVYSDVRLTDADRQYRRQKLWDYMEVDLEKWGEVA